MEQQQIKEILAAIKNVCPQDLGVSILPTKRRGCVNIIHFHYRSARIDVDDWAYEVHRLHWDKVHPLLQQPGDFRELYCCGNHFIFYSPFDGIFSRFEHPLEYQAYGHADRSWYFGECENIKDLIMYLTETPDVIF